MLEADEQKFKQDSKNQEKATTKQKIASDEIQNIKNALLNMNTKSNVAPMVSTVSNAPAPMPYSSEPITPTPYNGFGSQQETSSNNDEKFDEDDDEEIRKFETLEKYVDEHPSFRSSISFVDTLFANKHKNINNPTNIDETDEYEENETTEMYENEPNVENAVNSQQMLMFKLMKDLYEKSDGIEDVESYNARLESLFKEYESFKPPNNHQEISTEISEPTAHRRNTGLSEKPDKKNNIQAKPVSRKVKRIDEWPVSYNQCIENENSQNSTFREQATNNVEENEYDNRKYDFQSTMQIKQSNQKFTFNDNSVWLDQTLSSGHQHINSKFLDEEKAKPQPKAAATSSTQMSELINKLFPSIRNQQNVETALKKEEPKFVQPPPPQRQAECGD